MESSGRLSQLPDEIWVHILDYLEPSDLLPIQRTSSRLFQLARDTSLWRAKCFEQAPSASRALSGRTSALEDLLNGLSLSDSTPNRTTTEHFADGRDGIRASRRARAIADWDCTNKEEKVDWYSEFISRHAPLSTEWLHAADGNEIRSMSLFDHDQRILSAMEDGSLRIWDVQRAPNCRRSLKESARSRSGMLFANLSTHSGPSQIDKQKNVGTAIDNSVVDSSRSKAYVAIEETLNEIDLNTMQLVSQEQFAWRITALSQQAGDDLPLMVGTSFSLNMHDPRLSLRHVVEKHDERLETASTPEEEKIVFLPNYGKDKRFQSASVLRGNRLLPSPSARSIRKDLTSWARVEPGPQSILHRGDNEIIIAGRMPSILFYDKRTFPELHSVIHSGARLSALTLLTDIPPYGSKCSTAEDTLIACGEYQGRGSLEIYELPYHRPLNRSPRIHERAVVSDSQRAANSGSRKVYLEEVEVESEGSDESETESDEPSTLTSVGQAYSYKNRQSSSSAKLLSIATQGTRIVFSDSEGTLKWFERDGKGLARRWNINSYVFSHTGGVLVGDSVARKICTFAEDEKWQSGKMQGMTRGDGDLLIWTGSEIGIVTSKLKWEGHDDLVKEFEEKMNLNGNGERKSGLRDVRDDSREEEYSRVMRRALERQADERRWMSRFGMRPR